MFMKMLQSVVQLHGSHHRIVQLLDGGILECVSLITSCQNKLCRLFVLFDYPLGIAVSDVYVARGEQPVQKKISREGDHLQLDALAKRHATADGYLKRSERFKPGHMIVTTLCNAPFWVRGITVDSYGNIYFTAGENVYRISKNSSESQIIVNVNGEGLLWGIIWMPNNVLYICASDSDKKNHTIFSYSIEGGLLKRYTGSFLGHKDGNIKEAQFKHPYGITIDLEGNLLVTQNHCIRRISLSQESVSTIAGSPNTRGHQDGDTSQSFFFVPWEIVQNEDGTIYVTDYWNHCIRKIKDGIVSTIAGTPGKEGFQDGPTTKALFRCPRSLVQVDNTLLVGDRNGLRILNLKNNMVVTENSTRNVQILSLAKDRSGVVYGGCENAVVRIVDVWRWERLLWIGHLKENADCLFAGVPREIIREITYHLYPKKNRKRKYCES